MKTTAPARTLPSVLDRRTARTVESFSPVTILAEAPALSVAEITARPGEEPPMHVHAREDEVFYVLEGSLTIWVDGEEHRAAAGACAVLPAGLSHTFAIDSNEARLLVICAPGGFQGMFDEVRAPIDMALAEQAMARYGVTITGPNPRYA